MKRILSDFYKSQIPTLIRYAFITVLCVGVFLFTGIFVRENTRVMGIIITAFLCGITLYSAIEVFLLSKARFKKRLETLSESEANEVVSGYQSATALGKRRFYKDTWLMLWARRKIDLLRYDEITAADFKHGNISLTLKSGKTYLMPVEPNENAIMLAAVIKGFCENAKITLDGRAVSADEGKDKT